MAVTHCQNDNDIIWLSCDDLSSFIFFTVQSYELRKYVHILHIMVWWSYSFVCALHYFTTIIMQSYLKILSFYMLVMFILSSECPRLSRFAQLSFHTTHGAVCIQLTHSSCGDCGIKCSLSFYYHQIGSMTHLALFRVESWNNRMRCISF